MDVTVYWLTFYVEEKVIDGIEPGKRRAGLYRVVEDLSGDMWKEPTSFVFFDSPRDIDFIAGRCREVIAITHDIVLIGDQNRENGRVVGKVQDLSKLRYFMDYVRTT